MSNILLRDKNTKPPFEFVAKSDTCTFHFYAYHTFDEAAEKARILSLTGFPAAVLFEVVVDGSGEYRLRRLFRVISGEFREDEKILLHVKFYTDAGNCLNKEEM